ncbi:MAG: hypothetical protein A2W28_03060 [Gammaproteobacteria bacterium RBG_16_51_14]|nr:MAG: hypothetical protein A2W28_03060 [Gammaproteobacteria bacterium RBG_16_51_14]
MARELVVNWRYTILLVIAVILVYLPGLPGGFIYDDYVNILQNEFISNSGFSIAGAWETMKSGIAGPLGRPLPMLSFYLGFKLSGFSPLGYKLFNITVHAVNAVLVFIVVRRILYFLGRHDKFSGGRLGPELTAFWVTLLWAVHPINLTSVLYVVQRMTSMAATFTLIGIYIYQRIRETQLPGSWKMAGGLGLVILAGLISAMYKETGLLLFLYLLVFECFLYRWQVTSGRVRQYLNIFYALTVALPFCAAVYLSVFGDLLAGYDTRPFDLQQRVLTESRVIWFYISQILLPQAHLFSLYHDDFIVSAGLWEPLTTLLSIIGIIFIVSAGIKYAGRFPWLGFGIAFFLCGHALESTIFPLILVFEHRNYLPSLGLVVILVLSLRMLLNLSKNINSNPVFAIISLLFASVTASMAYDWSNIPLLAERMVQRHPASSGAHYELGYTYMKLYEAERNPVFAGVSLQAFRDAYLLADRSRKLERAIVLYHMTVLYGKPRDQALLDEILNAFRNRKVVADDMKALLRFINCRNEAICNTDDSTCQEIFTNLLDNPGLQGSLRDDVLYIYATYLVTVPGREEKALVIMRDIVARNPENLAYKVKLISVLLTNEYRAEAYKMMDELTQRYGTEWKIIRK